MQRVHYFLYRTLVKGMDRFITFGTGFWCHFIMKELVVECIHLRLGNTGCELRVDNCLSEVSTTAGNRPTILAVELNQEEKSVIEGGTALLSALLSHSICK